MLAAESPGLPHGLEAVRRYYDRKIGQHGATPLGVDWSCEATQQLRFAQLLKVTSLSGPASINDVGCGYGALADFVHRRHGCEVDYLGFDLSPAMIAQARSLARLAACRFEVARRSPRVADYCVGSGLFNVKLDHSAPAWRRLVRATLADMANNSRRGLAVNFLQPAAGGGRTPQLYATYAAPWVRYCERDLGLAAQVIGGYGLPEFTLLARRWN